MLSSSLIGVALLAVSTQGAADYFRWKGLTANFDEDALWSGPNPGNAVGDIPSQTTVGTPQTTTVTMLPKSKTYTVGTKLLLLGNTKLFLGDGKAGSKTIISFASSTAATPTPTEFALDFTSGISNNSTFYDYGCHLNWERVSDGTARMTNTPPCYNSNVLFSSSNAYYLDTFEGKYGADKISVGETMLDAQDYLTSCTKINSVYSSVPLTINFHGFVVCKRNFNFRKDDFASQTTCETSCPGTVVPLPDGSTIVVQTGDRTGTVTKVAKDGTSTDISGDAVVNPDGSVDIPAKGDEPAVKVSGTGTIITASPTMAPTSANGGDTSTSTGANQAAGGMGIVIGTVVGGLVFIVAIVIVVVVLVKKSASKSSDDRNIVSFENPMYDDVTAQTTEASYSEQEDTGIYDDPEMTGTDGYMDVPAANGGNSDNGYMDVPANSKGTGGSGYMDVAPNEEQDTDDSEGEDNEDI